MQHNKLTKSVGPDQNTLDEQFDHSLHFFDFSKFLQQIDSIFG